jgi:hypothetical protein
MRLGRLYLGVSVQGRTDSLGSSALASDRPIQHRAEDQIGRLPIVDLIAEDILAAPTDDGFVMALTAPWGEGKTSVLNLVADSVAQDVAVVRFNPWLFTDAQALVARFFNELSAQVIGDQRLRTVAKRFAAYGQVVAPVGSLLLGPAAALAGQSLGALAALNANGVGEDRDRLKEALVQQERRLLVLVDDIDRLHDEEILDVMRLVKLVGDLPFVTYLLAFDRPYVEKALHKDQFDGRSYLEKVVQVTYDLPTTRPAQLQGILFERLNTALGFLEHLPVNQERWSEVFERGMAPFFNNLRDVTRYVSSVPGRVRLIGKEVALEDILALEALRVFEPGVHQILPRLVSALTKERPGIFINHEAEDEKDDALINAAVNEANPARESAVRALLATLFPRAGDALGGPMYRSDAWRAKRQVADASAFRAYLHATLDPGTASYVFVIDVLNAFGDRAKLRRLLGTADAAVLQDFIQRIPDFRDRIKVDSVAIGAGELLRLQSRVPDDQEFLRPAPKIYLKRAIQTVLAVVSDPSERQRVLEGIYESAEGDSERLSVLHWFGTFPQRERKQPDAEILNEEATTRVEEDLRTRVRALSPEQLLEEEELVWLVFVGFGNDDEGRAELKKRIDDRMMLRLIKACTGMSLDDGETFFNLRTADRLFERGWLREGVARLQKVSGLSAQDQEVLEKAVAALDTPPDAQNAEASDSDDEL